MRCKLMIVNVLVFFILSGDVLSEERLLLAGGSLPICSSVTPHQCENPDQLDARAYQQARYRLDQASLQRLQQHPDADLQRLALLAIELVDDQQQPRVLDRGELIRALEAVYLSRTGRNISALVERYGLHSYQARFPDDPAVLNGQALLDGLSDARFSAALSLLEDGPAAGQTRAMEQVRLNESKNSDSVAVMQRFFSMAQARIESQTDQAVRIVFSTASSHDSFEAVDFYQQLFEQLGAQAEWLPLDRSVAKARAEGRCHELELVRAELTGLQRRDEVYPDLAERQQRFCGDSQAAIRLIESAHGLFFNGGDQSFTRAAWFDGEHASAELQLLRQRFVDGEIAVGGTSAGTAVQAAVSTAMISNGGARQALFKPAVAGPPPAPGCARDNSCGDLDAEQMSYQPDGGLGLFDHGLIDTHFSERVRELRMLMLAAQTGQSQAWGVDETTALVVAGEGPVAVVGAAGAWQLYGDSAPAMHVVQNVCQVGPARVHFHAAGRLDAVTALSSSAPPEACFKADAGFDLGEVDELRQPVQRWVNDPQAPDHLIANVTANGQTARLCWHRDQHTKAESDGYRHLNLTAILDDPGMC